MVDQNVFRTAMSRLGAAVNVITSDGPGGLHGMTASAVCSVTDSPPTILVCVNRSSAANAVLKTNGVLCVNILTGRHSLLSTRFSQRAVSIAERFSGAAWTRLVTGSPALEDASAALDCRVSEVTEIGTHSVFFCHVLQALVAERAEGLIYFNRGYHPLEEGAPL